MLLGGRAADIFGRRRMFILWLAAFVLFSGLGGLATEGWMLLVARFATGVAAAFMTPAGLSLITTNFAEGPQRNKAVLVYAGTAAAGFSLGLVVGGLLTAISWRWVFFAPVVLSIVILVAAIVFIEDSARSSRSAHRADLAGAISVTGAMLLLVYGVIRLENPGKGLGWTMGTFVVGLALIAAFVAIERRSASPLVRLGILRSGPLMRANLGAMLFAGSFFGFQFLVTLYLQELRGWSTVETGLALLAIGIDSVLAPTLTPRLVNRFGNVRVIFVGLALATAAYALFLPVGLDWTYTSMFPTMIILGVSFSLVYGPLTIAATDGVAADEQGLAGGLFGTAFQFGAALGLSAVTAVNVVVLGSAESIDAGLDAVRAALIVPVVAAALAVAVTGFGLRRRTRPVLETSDGPVEVMGITQTPAAAGASW
jgi:MFS family permease